VSETSIRLLLREAFDLGSTIYDESDAVTWAGGFLIPEEAKAADDRLWVQHGGSFNDMVRSKHSVIAQDRLSPDRVRRFLSSDNPHFEALLDLAVNGVSLYALPRPTRGAGGTIAQPRAQLSTSQPQRLKG